MPQQFYKYQGTGNDFILIDNRQLLFDKNNTKHIALLCDRRFGIGADGLILLENHSDYNFKMVYYNADGNESSMCGNGGRCISAFAKHLGVVTENEFTFEAVDGPHDAEIKKDEVRLKMKDVKDITVKPEYVFLNTGSPHHIVLVDDVKTIDVKKEGAKIRYSELYGKEGSNVNFVSAINNTTFTMRTYERGVEDETLSCGTGVTAVAIAMYYTKKSTATSIKLKTLGGDLAVSFTPTANGFEDVWLSGPAKLIFTGKLL